MLASELAQELGIEPSVMTKRIGAYFLEKGVSRERHLSEKTVENLREAHALFDKGEARSFKDAVQLVLGTYLEPVPPESARLIMNQLEALTRSQADLLQKLDQVMSYFETSIDEKPEPHAGQSDGDFSNLAPEIFGSQGS